MSSLIFYNHFILHCDHLVHLKSRGTIQYNFVFIDENMSQGLDMICLTILFFLFDKCSILALLWIGKVAFCRYYDTRLSDQQMALLQYQRDNIHYLSEEVLETFIFLSYVI
jgi:hypothetical protein